MQSKKRSLIEAIANTFIGYGVNFTANLIILPWFGFDISLAQNALIGFLYTLISIVRGYAVRRLFNRTDK